MSQDDGDGGKVLTQFSIRPRLTLRMFSRVKHDGQRHFRRDFKDAPQLRAVWFPALQAMDLQAMKLAEEIA